MEGRGDHFAEEVDAIVTKHTVKNESAFSRKAEILHARGDPNGNKTYGRSWSTTLQTRQAEASARRERERYNLSPGGGGRIGLDSVVINNWAAKKFTPLAQQRMPRTSHLGTPVDELRLLPLCKWKTGVWNRGALCNVCLRATAPGGDRLACRSCNVVLHRRCASGAGPTGPETVWLCDECETGYTTVEAEKFRRAQASAMELEKEANYSMMADFLASRKLAKHRLVKRAVLSLQAWARGQAVRQRLFLEALSTLRPWALRIKGLYRLTNGPQYLKVYISVLDDMYNKKPGSSAAAASLHALGNNVFQASSSRPTKNGGRTKQQQDYSSILDHNDQVFLFETEWKSRTSFEDVCAEEQESRALGAESPPLFRLASRDSPAETVTVSRSDKGEGRGGQEEGGEGGLGRNRNTLLPALRECRTPGPGHLSQLFGTEDPKKEVDRWWDTISVPATSPVVRIVVTVVGCSDPKTSTPKVVGQCRLDLSQPLCRRRPERFDLNLGTMGYPILKGGGGGGGAASKTKSSQLVVVEDSSKNDSWGLCSTRFPVISLEMFSYPLRTSMSGAIDIVDGRGINMRRFATLFGGELFLYRHSYSRRVLMKLQVVGALIEHYTSRTGALQDGVFVHPAGRNEESLLLVPLNPEQQRQWLTTIRSAAKHRAQTPGAGPATVCWSGGWG